MTREDDLRSEAIHGHHLSGPCVQEGTGAAPAGTHAGLGSRALSEILEAIDEGLLVLDHALHCTHLNAKAASLIRVPRARILGEHLWEAVPDFAGVDLAKALERAMVERQEVKLVCQRASRSQWFEYRIRPLVDGIAIFLADITERVWTEEALRKNVARLRVGYERAPVGICEADEEGTFLHVNERFCEITGYTREELIGRTFQSITHPDDVQADVDAFRRMYADEISNYRMEKRYIHKDGHIIWIELLGAIVRNEDGSVDFAIGMVLDISTRKRAMAALQEADRRKDEFIAMLAHELRNPLGPIRNVAALLRSVETQDVMLTKLREILDRQVAHMARLIDDLLDISRITRGKIFLQEEPVELGTLVQITVEDYRSTCEGKGIALGLEVAALPLWIRGDRTRIAQVVGNLLHNAWKFTGAGGSIQVVVDRDGDWGRIAVRDTGIGMDPAFVPGMFESFAQAHQGLDRGHGGLGLGLALVKGLVTLHRGTVSAHSEGQGKGLEVLVRLPLDVPLQIQDTPSMPAPAACPRRILVIDDNADAAESLRMLLALGGHAVEVANTGRAGLTKARAFVPHIVICDIGLPDMDGYEVCRRLRRNPELTGMCLVALTGYGQESDQQRAREAGFHFHLTKPVDPAVLTRILAE